MGATVAVVKLDEPVHASVKRALTLIGTDDVNTTERTVVIKPGIFEHTKKNHPTINVLHSIITCFNNASRVFIAESDNYRGTGSERLQIYNALFTERVAPFNLSDNLNTRNVIIADETMRFSHILFKPNVFVSIHALRKYAKGTVLKNLLGVLPEQKKGDTTRSWYPSSSTPTKRSVASTSPSSMAPTPTPVPPRMKGYRRTSWWRRLAPHLWA
jgi:hypothetical protein